jgi:protein-S-isoprenylcysteine O-methyltransferase Ste14
VVEAGKIDVEAPTKLLTGGPYSFSRNPMYIGWTLIYLGTALAANSVWMIALLPIVMVFTHVTDVRNEERFLAEKFGNEYLEYQGRVRRYL